MGPLILRGPEATRALGERLAALLAPGDFVGLVGELGAGKTALSRAVCEALGVPREDIASPTFAIASVYEGRVPVIHADLYRIEGEDDLAGTGIEDLVDARSVQLVEWIDRAPSLAPAAWLRIELRHSGPDAREAWVEGFGPRGEDLARGIGASSTA